MKQKIKSIEKGWGADSQLFTVGQTVDEIKEDSKPLTTDKRMKVYRGYLSGKIVFEMESNSGLTIIYE